jgi:hypothetical protein
MGNIIALALRREKVYETNRTIVRFAECGKAPELFQSMRLMKKCKSSRLCCGAAIIQHEKGSNQHHKEETEYLLMRQENIALCIAEKENI